MFLRPEKRRRQRETDSGFFLLCSNRRGSNRDAEGECALEFWRGCSSCARQRTLLALSESVCEEFRTLRRKVPLLSMQSLRKNKNSTEFVVLYLIDVIPLFATLPNWSSDFQPISFHHIGPHMCRRIDFGLFHVDVDGCHVVRHGVF